MWTRLVCGLLISTLSYGFMGCDSYYHLVPAPIESRIGLTSSVDRLVFDKQGLRVEVSGGSMVPGPKRKGMAVWLTIEVNIAADSTWQWAAPTVCLLSAGKRVRSCGLLAHRQESNSNGNVEILTKDKDEWSAPSELRTVIPAGKTTYQFRFGAEDGGLNALQFPIMVYLGTISRAQDTLKLDSLSFNMKTGRPNRED
jgi:hypothetical protein